MILRRFANAIRRQDWFTVVLEVVIVMIGIFLGLQANAWNQSRIDRAEEAAFLEALYDDVTELENISKRLVSIRVERLTHIANAVDVLSGRADWRELTKIECDAIRTSDVVEVNATSLPSWIALRDAGRTGILRDEELRRALTTLSQKRESLDRISAAVRASNFNLKIQYPELFQVESIRVEIADAPGLIHHDTITICDTRGISENQMVMNALASNLNGYSAVVQVSGIKPWADQVSEIREMVEGKIRGVK